MSKPLLDSFISLVVPLHNEGDEIAEFVQVAGELLRSNYTNYEILLVDNGSHDTTVPAIQAILGSEPCVRLIRLSRTHDREVALYAGLEASIGDFVVTLIPGVDPLASVEPIVDTLRDGHDIVYGVATPPQPVSWTTKLGIRLFRWYSERYLRLRTPTHATYLMGWNRRAVNALTRVKSHSRHIRIVSSQVGFATATYKYRPIQPDQYRDRNFWHSVNLAIDISVSYSRHPLRFISYLGMAAGFLNLLYVIYVLFVYFYQERVAEGWTTLSLQASFMFLFIFMILTVLSEYIGKILEESKDQPTYHVMEELGSDRMLADSSRRNIHR